MTLFVLCYFLLRTKPELLPSTVLAKCRNRQEVKWPIGDKILLQGIRPVHLRGKLLVETRDNVILEAELQPPRSIERLFELARGRP
jgi:hypothetical protein